MTAVTRAKAYRVTFEVTQRHAVDVLAIADWQAIEIARSLYEMGCDVVQPECESPDAGGWQASLIAIGGQS